MFNSISRLELASGILDIPLGKSHKIFGTLETSDAFEVVQRSSNLMLRSTGILFPGVKGLITDYWNPLAVLCASMKRKWISHLHRIHAISTNLWR